MRPLALTILLLAATAGAGCATPEAGPDGGAGAPAPEAQVVPWGLEDCVFVNWFVPVDAEALRPHLPDGFEPTVGTSLPMGVGPEQAYLGFEAFRCASGAGLTGDVADMEYGSIFTSALPPEHLRVDGVELYIVKWDALVPDAPRREALAAAGLPVRDGTARPEHVETPTGAARVAGVLTLEGLGMFRYDGAPALRSSDGGGEGVRFFEFTPTPNGLATWDATYSLGAFSVGEGALEVPSGTWPAEVIGSERARASYFAGRWTFHDASLTLPPR